MITKWLKDSGLVVNENKTEVCLFHRNDKPKITINVAGCRVRSKDNINVLGVTFDSKLEWSSQVRNCISKAKRALFGLRILKKYFTNSQMRLLLDSNFYSILYYNAIIWLTPELKSQSKHDLLAISANALRTCLSVTSGEISFQNIHKNLCKCTPEQIMYYQLSLNAYKTLNNVEAPLDTETIRVLDQIICTRRQVFLETHKINRYKIGMNSNENKLYHIRKLILLEKLDYSFVHFKKEMKGQFLKYGKT